MARKSTPQVSAKQVLNAISEIRRRRQWPLLQELEAAEPELTEFVLEELRHFHHELLKTGAHPKIVRRLQRRIQSLVLVCVLTLRHTQDGPKPAADPPAAQDPQAPNPP